MRDEAGEMALMLMFFGFFAILHPVITFSPAPPFYHRIQKLL
jgi:hypothetical protein